MMFIELGLYSNQKEAQVAERPLPGCAGNCGLLEGLLRVELNDELFSDVFRDVLALREVEELANKLIPVHFQMRKRTTITVGCILNDEQILASRADFNEIARPKLVARNTRYPVVHHDVAVVDKLPRLAACTGKTEAEYNVIESGLQEFQEVLAGHTFFGGGFLKEVPELTLKQAVRVLRLLLFLELYGILAVLASAVVAVLAGAVGLALQRL